MTTVGTMFNQARTAADLRAQAAELRGVADRLERMADDLDAVQIPQIIHHRGGAPPQPVGTARTDAEYEPPPPPAADAAAGLMPSAPTDVYWKRTAQTDGWTGIWVYEGIDYRLLCKPQVSRGAPCYMAAAFGPGGLQQPPGFCRGPTPDEAVGMVVATLQERKTLRAA